MTRRALIISNPGESGAENYCAGVVKDVENYTAFLKSALGGAWRDNEIIKLHRPTKSRVKDALVDLDDIDYTFIVFTGHGYFSQLHDTTMLELKADQEIDYSDLRKGAYKRTLLLDCCRKIERDLVLESSAKVLAQKMSTELHALQCRSLFDKQVNECNRGIVVGFACSEDETAGDSETKGGYYSYSLIRCATLWSQGKSIDLSKYCSVYSIVGAHNDSVKMVAEYSGDNQHPAIEKSRTDPYFPFAIMA